MSTPSSPAHAVVKRPPVAKKPATAAILTRQSSTRNLYKMGEKAATHDAMIHRFQLRKMSSDAHFKSKFGRASDVVIDKAIGASLQQKRRFSLHRLVRSITSTKARQHALQALSSTITPKSWTSTIHGIVMLAVYHFQLLYLPFFASYYPEGTVRTASVGILLETVFLMDVLLNFNTAYIDQGALVKARNKIAQNYIQKWFVFDLLSAIPLQAAHYIVTSSTEHTDTAVRNVQITLMVLRLLRGVLLEKGVLVGRVMRVASHLTEWVRYSRYSHLLGIAQLMWIVLLFAHYMACIWHIVSRDNFSHAVQAKTVAEQYVADYYYAVSLIQGQGNAGGTWDENLYSSVAIIMGSVILAIVFGNVAMLVSNFNANSTNYHRKMEAVYATMDKMDLPLRLRERVNEYYKHVWHEYEALDGNVNKFQQELTHTLGIEIGLYKHMNLVVKVSFWEDCTPDFLTQIVLNLGVRVYMPDDYVVRRRETGSEMMMINRGYCKLSKPSKSVDEENAVEDDTTTSNNQKPVFSSQDLTGADSMEMNQFSDGEGDSDSVSSDDEADDLLRGGMFGASIDQRRMPGKPFDPLDDNPTNFTDVDRFRHVHPRRPSYPHGLDPKKARRHQEYLRPGQAFGEMSLLMNYKRTANIRAVTFVEMCVLDRSTFQQIISRYPEDRRRVLTKMLESCIDKKVIPFPWEKIIEAVAVKRRNSGKKDISRASVIATMTAKEAARILVEAIDVSAPDETIKYGFQSFDQEFIDDSFLRDANSTDAKISDTLQRRTSSIRQSSSRRNSRIVSNDGSSSMGDLTEANSETLTSPSVGEQSNTTLKNLLLLMQSMATNIERLQQDVNQLKTRKCDECKHCGTTSQHAATTSGKFAPRSSRAADRLNKTMKEDHQAQIARTPSLVSIPGIGTKTNTMKKPISVLRKIRSNTQDGYPTDRQDRPISPRKNTNAAFRPATPQTTEVLLKTEAPLQQDTDRYPATLSSRSKAARNPTLADMLWKRSNTSGDLLKHTDEERSAARVRRQMRTRLSLPSEITAEEASPRAEDSSEEQKPIAAPDPDEPLQPATAWLPRSQRTAASPEFWS